MISLKTNLQNRINRISGQISGIEKMISDGRSCESIVQQIMAVRSALAQVATKIITAESCKFENHRDPEKIEKLLKRLIDIN